MMQKLTELRQMKEELNNPHDSERVRAAATVLAEIERQYRQSTINVADAAPVDTDLAPIDPEERVNELCDLLAAKLPGGPTITDIWLQNCLPDDFETDDPATLAAYAGMDRSEWDGQVARWADSVRHQHDGLDGYNDRDLADRHVQAHWGVSLERFEEQVVYLTDERAMEDLMAAPSKQTIDALDATAEALA